MCQLPHGHVGLQQDNPKERSDSWHNKGKNSALWGGGRIPRVIIFDYEEQGFAGIHRRHYRHGAGRKRVVETLPDGPYLWFAAGVEAINNFTINFNIRQYNIYTLTQTSGTYKKEIENGIDAISKQINALIDNLNVEITNIINQENVFSIIDLQAKLSVSNQMINYDSIDDIIENSKIVYEDKDFRIKKENGIYKLQISYLNNWIDISKKDLKKIDPKNYEKFNEITKSNIDLNFGKEI